MLLCFCHQNSLVSSWCVPYLFDMISTWSFLFRSFLCLFKYIFPFTTEQQCGSHSSVPHTSVEICMCLKDLMLFVLILRLSLSQPKFVANIDITTYSVKRFHSKHINNVQKYMPNLLMRANYGFIILQCLQTSLFTLLWV